MITTTCYVTSDWRIKIMNPDTAVLWWAVCSAKNNVMLGEEIE